MAGEMDVHIILDDPAGNSYLQVTLYDYYYHKTYDG